MAARLNALIATGKDLFTLLRDLALFSAAVLLLVFPSTFNGILTAAGFEEGNFAGLKWKKELVQNDIALKEAIVTIEELRRQLQGATDALQKVGRGASDQQVSTQVADITARAAEAQQIAGRSATRLRATVQAGTPLIAQATAQTTSDTKWVVVFGGDSSLERARDETTVVAPKLGIPNPEIYERQGVFRSVAVTDSRTEADRVLRIARQRRPDAYVVALQSWCPNRDAADGIVTCR